MTEVTFEMHAGQPDIELVKHHAVRQSDRAKQLGFSKLEETDIGAVENNSGSVDVAPTHALLNPEFLVCTHLHSKIGKRRSRTTSVMLPNHLTVYLVQEFQKHLVELFRLLDVRNVTGVFYDFQSRATDLLMHFFGVLQRGNRVLAPNNNKCRGNYLREDLRLVISCCHSE